MPPLQDRYQEEPATDPSVDQDNEANEAESDARASSVEHTSSAEQEEAAAQEFMTTDNVECPNDVLKR